MRSWSSCSGNSSRQGRSARAPHVWWPKRSARKSVFAAPIACHSGPRGLSMPSLLARNADVVVTMDGERRELKNAGLYAENGIIKQVGPTAELPKTADTVIDLAGQILLPGLVNTHHHLNQTLTRNFPGAQNNNLFAWLRTLYRAWARTDAESSHASTLIGLAELALSGCTTVFDHSYVFKNGNNVDCQIEAARDLGVRFHASRGSMSRGESKGGLPPDDCVEDEAFILKDSQRVIETHHDAAP